MTLEELNDTLPNGFHDAQLFSIELNYGAGTATLHLSLSGRIDGRPRLGLNGEISTGHTQSHRAFLLFN